MGGPLSSKSPAAARAARSASFSIGVDMERDIRTEKTIKIMETPSERRMEM